MKIFIALLLACLVSCQHTITHMTCEKVEEVFYTEDRLDHLVVVSNVEQTCIERKNQCPGCYSKGFKNKR